jgi:hypothetical protein
MTVQSIAPVQKSITVNVSRERAFEVFTARMGSWWKPEHHIAEQPFVDLVVEPRPGGSWHEVDAAGRTCVWGDVLVWDPPARVVLGWHLNAEYEYDPDLVTEVEVRFVEEGPATTRVELEHRNLDRLGEQAQTARAGLDGEGGWAGLLVLFAAASSVVGPASEGGSVVKVRRSGGFAGRTSTGSVDLDGVDPRALEARALVDRIDLARARTGLPHPDGFVYSFRIGDTEVSVPEQHVTDDLRRLADLVLGDGLS